jgi:hypothetical protein
MPGMRTPVVDQASDVVAAFVADLHLSLNAPAARSAEPDWLAAQERPLFQLRELLHRLGHPPLFYAGDIFDRWNVVPELINFAIEKMPPGFAVMGNHEMPYHDRTQMNKSAYYTLAQAGVIKAVPEGGGTRPVVPGRTESVNVYGFDYGEEITPASSGDGLQVAVVHRYIWTKETGHPGAKDEDKAYPISQELEAKGYHVGIFGDNHKPFDLRRKGCHVVNCGAFIRRKSDEYDYVASVVLLQADGTVLRHDLDTSQELWTESPQVKTQERDHSAAIDFVESLRTDASSSVSFREAMTRYMEANDLDEGTKTVLHRIMEHGQG